MRRALVFDLDGTLVDTAPDLHMVLGEVMQEIGLPAPPIAGVRSMVGDGALALIERALAAAGRQAERSELDRLYARFLAIYTADPCRASKLFPGVDIVLGELAAAGYRLGICTNKPQAPSLGLLEKLGIAKYFAVVIGGDVLPVRKPHPGHLTAVIERLGGTLSSALMVGDSRNDLLAARAVGIPCVLVSFGYTVVPARELGADCVIDAFTELHAAVRMLLPAA